MKELTARQKEIASYISSFITENGYSPSVRDVASHFHFSPKAAHDHLCALERKGVIRRNEAGLSRTMEVISEQYAPFQEMINVPVLGNIAAGKPIMSEENMEDTVPIPASMLKRTPDPYYALKVRGESMVGAGIFDGDLAIIRHATTARNGDIVVASVGEMESNAITLKRFYRDAHMIELRAENPEIGPIRTTDCQIHGTLFLLIRNYGG
ncbi:transcriptional repressor LexA [Parasphaerochaeta coccoides]|uniref:LexA repressor n=1 Tax=Parasphaerochaeta coccoides (strain ATCC BAA-1237 / DSM 17374 / SPN1) TaxID=760011 RepID=F4GJP5_PARC1|nr:transcriptional repressor LexA [Parasphaerochaeta coccoides]AEC02792.1 SOS-response transcriptional repressor, LexA [Parasphaerochaeta coccoides DSM 17374]